MLERRKEWLFDELDLFGELGWEDDAFASPPPPRPVLRRGATGRSVFRLQRLLNLHGYGRSGRAYVEIDLVEDGFWGPLTDRAVRAFQQGARLAADGVVRPNIWAALERSPARTPLLRRRAGVFADFIPKFLDQPMAGLLNRMLRTRASSWNQDTGDLVREGLQRSDLLGMVRNDTYPKLLARVHRETRAHMPTQQRVDQNGFAEHIPVADRHSNHRGMILVNGPAFTASIARDSGAFARLVLAHEANHFRNRVRIDIGLPGLPPLDRDPVNGTNFVDPALALRTGGITSRKHFIIEVAARHVAWHVQQELRTGPGRPPATLPRPGQLFSAAAAFANQGLPGQTGYNDSGYMATLQTRGAEVLQRQVALWLRDTATIAFHGDPSVDRAVRQFFTQEFAAARASGFNLTAPADGMA